MIPEPITWMAAGVGIFILGLLIGMALERSASRNARESETDEHRTDWEGDQ